MLCIHVDDIECVIVRQLFLPSCYPDTDMLCSIKKYKNLKQRAKSSKHKGIAITGSMMSAMNSLLCFSARSSYPGSYSEFYNQHSFPFLV